MGDFEKLKGGWYCAPSNCTKRHHKDGSGCYCQRGEQLSSDVREQLLADLICLAVEDDNVDGHVIFQKEVADRVNSDLERLVFRIAVDTR